MWYSVTSLFLEFVPSFVISCFLYFVRSFVQFLFLAFVMASFFMVELVRYVFRYVVLPFLGSVFFLFVSFSSFSSFVLSFVC